MSNVGLGLKRIWQLPKTDRLHAAGVWHDACYDIRNGVGLGDPEYAILSEQGKTEAAFAASQKSSKTADQGFLSRCFALAAGSRWHKFRAIFFYQICRAYGRFFW